MPDGRDSRHRTISMVPYLPNRKSSRAGTSMLGLNLRLEASDGISGSHTEPIPSKLRQPSVPALSSTSAATPPSHLRQPSLLPASILIRPTTTRTLPGPPQVRQARSQQSLGTPAASSSRLSPGGSQPTDSLDSQPSLNPGRSSSADPAVSRISMSRRSVPTPPERITNSAESNIDKTSKTLSTLSSIPGSTMDQKRSASSKKPSGDRLDFGPRHSMSSDSAVALAQTYSRPVTHSQRVQFTAGSSPTKLTFPITSRQPFSALPPNRTSSLIPTFGKESGALTNHSKIKSQPNPRLSPDVQDRLNILNRLEILVGTKLYQECVDHQALQKLVQDSALYETQAQLKVRLVTATTPEGTTPPHSPNTLSLNTSPNTPQPTPNHLSPPSVANGKSVTRVSQETTSRPSDATSVRFRRISWSASHNAGNSFLERLRQRVKSNKSSGNLSQPFSQTQSLNSIRSVKSFQTARSSQTAKSGRSPKSIQLSSQISSATISQPIKQEPPKLERKRSQIWGAPLHSLTRSTCLVLMGKNLHVLPTILFSVIEEIYRRGMRTPGILRISGDFDRIDSLLEMFEECAASSVDLSGEDIHTLCGLAKQYLRALPEPLFHPLLTELLWRACVEPDRLSSTGRSGSQAAQSRSLEVAKCLIKLLPTRSISLLVYFVSFLAQIPLFAENRVQYESLATIFGPAIFASRIAGLPGLGGYSKGGPSKRPMDPSTTGLIPKPANRPSSVGVALSTPERNKLDISFRAAESMLWMLGRWKSLIAVALDEEEPEKKTNETGEEDSMEKNRDSRTSKENLGSNSQSSSNQSLDSVTTPSGTQSDITAISCLNEKRSKEVDRRETDGDFGKPITSIEKQDLVTSPTLSLQSYGSQDSYLISNPGESPRTSEQFHLTASPEDRYERRQQKLKMLKIVEVVNQRSESEAAVSPRISEKMSSEQRRPFKKNRQSSYSDFIKPTFSINSQETAAGANKMLEMLTGYIGEREEKIRQQEREIEALKQENLVLKKVEEIRKKEIQMIKEKFQSTQAKIGTIKKNEKRVVSERVRRTTDFNENRSRSVTEDLVGESDDEIPSVQISKMKEDIKKLWLINSELIGRLEGVKPAVL